ncbi:MAG TPA: SRPBCC domain-containing protein [Longimicrobiaceae bacterium]|nr:SRPBCC domain-containing protein [Longimicrobiaceae bacterium]
MSSPAAGTLPPVRRSIVVGWPPEAAFHRFTTEMASWWPLRTLSVGQERAETVVFDGRVGGRIVEGIRGGEEGHWGTVTVWEPPHRVAFTWHPDTEPERATDVEVRFVPDGAGTRVELTHTGWERLGALAKEKNRGYSLGWAYVLRLYANRRGSPVVWGVDALTWVMGPLLRRKARKEAAAKAQAAGSAG